MTAIPPVTTPDADAAEQSPRVQLKPATPDPGGTGHVDGAWWPRSRDLTAELPVLLATLATRLGTVERVAYNLDEWQPAGRRLDGEGTRVRLDGFHSQLAGTVDVIGPRGRVTILVIPPEQPAESARTIALATADGRNVDPVDVLLARTGR